MRRMFARAPAIFLAFVLLWSGFARAEPSLCAGEISPLAAMHLQQGGDFDREDAPVAPSDIDEQAAPLHAEGNFDLPALVMAVPAAPVSALAMTRPAAYAAATPPAPYLDGLRRPPRGIVHLI
jgi:hypothetical protein